jgi:hypothetical protein
MANRADWRLYDYNGSIRAEVRRVEARHAAVAFQAFVNSVAMSGQAVPHPRVKVRRLERNTWQELTLEQKRQFWKKVGYDG